MIVTERGIKVWELLEGCHSLSLLPSSHFGDDESNFQFYSPTHHRPHSLCGTVHHTRATVSIPAIITMMDNYDTHSCETFIDACTNRNIDMLLLCLGAKNRHSDRSYIRCWGSSSVRLRFALPWPVEGATRWVLGRRTAGRRRAAAALLGAFLATAAGACI